MKKIFIKHREILLYIVFGFGTTCVNWGTYSFAIIGFGWKITVANILSWITATIFAFVTNKRWVFNSYIWKPRLLIIEFGKFVSSRLITGGFEVIAVPLLVKFRFDYSLFGISGFWSKISVSIIVVVLNYFISKQFIFKNKREY